MHTSVGRGTHTERSKRPTVFVIYACRRRRPLYCALKICIKLRSSTSRIVILCVRAWRNYSVGRNHESAFPRITVPFRESMNAAGAQEARQQNID